MVRGRRTVTFFVAALGVAACSTDVTSDAGGSVSTVDPGSEDAARKVKAFSCPTTATSAGKERTGPIAGRLQVVTTVAPITSIAANIAGDKADVKGVVPEGTNSHTFEPKPSVAQVLTRADVVLVNGLGLEEPTKDLAKDNVKAAGQIVELGNVTLTPDQHIYDFSFPRDGGKPNPHLWTDPPLARCYATAVASVLSRADPANATTYQANAATYTAKVDALDAAFRTASTTVPANNRKLVTYHDAYAYFAATYDWKVIGAIQVSSFEDPTPKEVAGIIKQVKAEGVPAIFGSEVFPSPVLEQIGKEAGVRYVDELRDDDLPGAPGDANHSFLALLKANYTIMVRALGGDPAAIEAYDPSDVVRDAAEYPQ